ncbi:MULTISPECIES: FKBP-type peptidyl-prolyl cis-trans isomerase [Subtercola]|uniref:Peptidyl-prolyl cis-trans isomerase n=1 Tax=Subtercola vilae TaxID=2056433 RepID=A0A4V4RG83_9MICO|nr:MULTISPECIES: FKBP-type peptidyl-prolyl cis-trans isomerase [Subtercola]MEA9983775.1 FKBP-type peptidyl-prolyl cis-trans isomerase [Subtercola sp. RTI3]TIH40684.1 peptidylprolyl isomerase [Subtercola vilae]
MRKSVALIVAAGLLATLAGCSSSGSSASGCTPQLSAGDASNTIAAAGAFGTAPTVTVNTPLHTADSQSTTLITGTGPRVETGDYLLGEYTFVDGATGAVVQKSAYNGSDSAGFVVGKLDTLPGLDSAVVCATQGSRLAVAMAPIQSTTSATPSTDSIVAVFDITTVFPSRADGAVQPAQAGFPSVALGPDGRPGITIPSGSLPTSQQVAVLKKGSGQTVAEGDHVVFKYTAVVWADKSVAKTTWDDGVPAAATASSSAPLATNIVPALVGQTVGSQYIAVVPPSAGYGDTASTTPVIPANSTLVYVVDVLGILPAAAAQ